MTSSDGLAGGGYRTLEEVEVARKERDIKAYHLATLAGFSAQQGWYEAVSKEAISDEKLRRANAVIDYFDENGFLPEPREIQGGEER